MILLIFSLVFVGTKFLSIFDVNLPNDLYVHILGSYIIGGSTFGIYTIISQIRQRFLAQTIEIFIKWIIWVRKSNKKI